MRSLQFATLTPYRDTTMKPSIKISLLVLSLTSVMGLTACQSNPNRADQPKMQASKFDHGHHKMHHKGKKHMHAERYARHGQPRLSPEQREIWQKQREQRVAQRQLIQQACNGKTSGQTIQVKVGDKTIDGTCQLRFKPTAPTTQTTPATT